MAYIKTKYKQDIILVINMLSMFSSFDKVNNSKKIGPLIGPSMETFSIIFLLKKAKKNSKNLVPIYCRVTLNGRRIELSTKRWVLNKQWDKKRQRAKPVSRKLKAINHFLEQIRSKFYLHHQRLLEKEIPFNVEDLKNAYLNKKEKVITLMHVIDTHNIEMEMQVGTNYSYGTYKNYKTLKRHIERFLKKEYKQIDLSIKRVDRDFVYNLETYLLLHTASNQNGAMKVMQRFKKITTRSRRRGFINYDPFDGYVFKFHKTEIEFLSQEEIDKLLQANLNTKAQKRARELFVFALYTGLSYSDVIQLKLHQIQIAKDNTKYILKKRKKTGELSIVPLLPPALEILAKHTNKEKKETDNVFKTICNQALNKQIKKMAIKAGIHKDISFHIARHTFATTITLNNDVPIETVSKMLGHSNIKTTQIYAKILQKKVCSDMQKLSEKLFK